MVHRPRAPLPTPSDFASVQQLRRRTAWAKAERKIVPKPQRLGRPLPTLRRTLRRTRRVLAQGRLGGGEAGDRPPERGTRHIVEPDLMAELDRGRGAAVFAANAELEVRGRLAAAVGSAPRPLAVPVPV